MRPETHHRRLTSLPPSGGGTHRERRRAFTLIELVIVILIMSIVAAAATPAFLDSLLFHRVESAARRLKADLELARSAARLTSRTQSIAFTGTGYTLSAAVKNLDHPGQSYTVNLSAPPYELSTVAANFNGNQAVTFDGYGTPSDGGTVHLTSKNHQCIVGLDATSGQITITSNHTRARTAKTSGP